MTIILSRAATLLLSTDNTKEYNPQTLSRFDRVINEKVTLHGDFFMESFLKLFQHDTL